jgi:hypothetical protein
MAEPEAGEPGLSAATVEPAALVGLVRFLESLAGPVEPVAPDRLEPQSAEPEEPVGP